MIGTKEKRESGSLRVLEGLLMAGFQERKNSAQSAEADVLSVSAGKYKMCLVVIHYLQWAFPSAMLSYRKRRNISLFDNVES